MGRDGMRERERGREGERDRTGVSISHMHDIIRLYRVYASGGNKAERVEAERQTGTGRTPAAIAQTAQLTGHRVFLCKQATIK